MLKKFIPDQLKKIRTLKSISAYSLAEKCGIGATAIYNYEKGIRIPSEDLVKMFSAFLEVDIDFFYKEDLVFQSPTDILNMIDDTKEKFNNVFNSIRDTLVCNGKINSNIIDVSNLLLRKDNIDSNNISKLFNQLEFLNLSLTYLQSINDTKESIYPETSVLNELNKYDTDELFFLLNNLSRLGILKMLLFGKKVLKKEQEIINTTDLSSHQKAVIAKVMEGAVTKKRMENSKRYSESEISHYIIENYGNTNLQEINYLLPELDYPINKDNEVLFETFLNKLLNEEML